MAGAGEARPGVGERGYKQELCLRKAVKAEAGEQCLRGRNQNGRQAEIVGEIDISAGMRRVYVAAPPRWEKSEW